MEEKILVKKGKELAFLLRHDNEALQNGLIDKHGWRQVSELCKEHGFTNKLIKDIVETNNKQRYELSLDNRKIRAVQGHSIDVDVELEEAVPPSRLYHGTTSETFYSHIVKYGLQKMSRQHVHLSADKETATNVGKRHGKDVYIIEIDSEAMHNDGIKFFLSKNGVWLTDNVQPKYFL